MQPKKRPVRTLIRTSKKKFRKLKTKPKRQFRRSGRKSLKGARSRSRQGSPVEIGLRYLSHTFECSRERLACQLFADGEYRGNRPQLSRRSKTRSNNGQADSPALLAQIFCRLTDASSSGLLPSEAPENHPSAFPTRRDRLQSDTF